MVSGAAVFHPCRCARRGDGHADRDLHPRCGKLVNLQQRHRNEHGYSDHSGEDHADGDGDAFSNEHHDGESLTVTIGVSGTPTPTGSVTLSSGSYTSTATTLVSGSAMITVPAGSLATSTDTLTATYTPDSNSSSTYNSATGSNTVTVAAASLTAQTITFTQPTTPVTWSSGLTIPLVATGGASGNPVTFSIDGSSTGTGSISGSTLNVTTPGTFVIDVNQAGNSTYSAAPQVQRTVVVNQAPQTITFTQPTTPVTYSGTSVIVPLSATGGASGNPVTFTLDGSSTGTGSISGSTLTVTSVGNFVIDANQAGNTDYTAAPQVQRPSLPTR